jgi:Ser/Thr protein kinase RdoA (MazF antagonist)
MVESQQSHNMLISLLGELANTSLKLWEVPAEASAKLINFSENATYLVSSSKGYRSILRIHRENYHNLRDVFANSPRRDISML